MKKSFFLVVLMSLIGFGVSQAQSSLLATLSHENDIKVFYGADALVSAHEAAVAGDIITLSSGTFNAVDVTKAVTIRGAGMAVDTVNNITPTILANSFSIAESDSTHNFVMEGIWHNGEVSYSGTLSRPQFIKCRFKIITSIGADAVLSNATFLNCRIADYINLTGYGNMFCNCIVEDPTCCRTESNQYYGRVMIDTSIYGSFMFYNCVLNFDTGHSEGLGDSSELNNCILCRSNFGGYKIVSGCSAYNCISVSYHGDFDIFKNIPNSTNKNCNYSVFKTFNTYSSIASMDDETFELTDEAKATYLGLDGTQVGIYGGDMTYDTAPSIPRITKCNVASKSTVDGKLSVDIQVNVVE